jgi:hypothetical protein
MMRHAPMTMWVLAYLLAVLYKGLLAKSLFKDLVHCAFQRQRVSWNSGNVPRFKSCTSIRRITIRLCELAFKKGRQVYLAGLEA